MPNETFIYPLQVSLLFIPLGLLDLFQAYILWDVLLCVLGLLIWCLTKGRVGNKKIQGAP